MEGRNERCRRLVSTSFQLINDDETTIAICEDSSWIRENLFAIDPERSAFEVACSRRRGPRDTTAEDVEVYLSFAEIRDVVASFIEEMMRFLGDSREHRTKDEEDDVCEELARIIIEGGPTMQEITGASPEPLIRIVRTCRRFSSLRLKELAIQCMSVLVSAPAESEWHDTEQLMVWNSLDSKESESLFEYLVAMPWWQTVEARQYRAAQISYEKNRRIIEGDAFAKIEMATRCLRTPIVDDSEKLVCFRTGPYGLTPGECADLKKNPFTLKEKIARKAANALSSTTNRRCQQKRSDETNKRPSKACVARVVGRSERASDHKRHIHATRDASTRCTQTSASDSSKHAVDRKRRRSTKSSLLLVRPEVVTKKKRRGDGHKNVTRSSKRVRLVPDNADDEDNENRQRASNRQHEDDAPKSPRVAAVRSQIRRKARKRLRRGKRQSKETKTTREATESPSRRKKQTKPLSAWR